MKLEQWKYYRCCCTVYRTKTKQRNQATHEQSVKQWQCNEKKTALLDSICAGEWREKNARWRRRKRRKVNVNVYISFQDLNWMLRYFSFGFVCFFFSLYNFFCLFLFPCVAFSQSLLSFHMYFKYSAKDLPLFFVDKKKTPKKDAERKEVEQRFSISFGSLFPVCAFFLLASFLYIAFTWQCRCSDFTFTIEIIIEQSFYFTFRTYCTSARTKPKK